MTRYYITKRYAHPANARAVAEYDPPEYIASINRTVYGWAQYDQPLTKHGIEKNGLIKGENR